MWMDDLFNKLISTFTLLIFTNIDKNVDFHWRKDLFLLLVCVLNSVIEEVVRLMLH